MHKIRSLHAKKPKVIMDFGCGTGGNIKYLLNVFKPEKLIAADISSKSLEIVSKKFEKSVVEVMKIETSSEQQTSYCDMVYCNGVFHHIPLSDRKMAMNYIFSSLKEGGSFFFWENNPWNLGTHWVMSRIPFDKNAIKIFPRTAKGMMKSNGFDIQQVRFLFIFPRFLKYLRFLEILFVKIPLGAQYLVFAKKNNGSQ